MRIFLIFIYLHLTTLLIGQNYVWESSRNGLHNTDIIRFENTAAYDIKDFRFNFKPYECSIGIPDSTFQGFTSDFYDSIKFLTLNPNIDDIENLQFISRMKNLEKVKFFDDVFIQKNKVIHQNVLFIHNAVDSLKKYCLKVDYLHFTYIDTLLLKNLHDYKSLKSLSIKEALYRKENDYVPFYIEDYALSMPNIIDFFCGGNQRYTSKFATKFNNLERLELMCKDSIEHLPPINSLKSIHFSLYGLIDSSLMVDVCFLSDFPSLESFSLLAPHNISFNGGCILNRALKRLSINAQSISGLDKLVSQPSMLEELRIKVMDSKNFKFEKANKLNMLRKLYLVSDSGIGLINAFNYKYDSLNTLYFSASSDEQIYSKVLSSKKLKLVSINYNRGYYNSFNSNFTAKQFKWIDQVGKNVKLVFYGLNPTICRAIHRNRNIDTIYLSQYGALSEKNCKLLSGIINRKIVISLFEDGHVDSGVVPQYFSEAFPNASIFYLKDIKEIREVLYFFK